MPREETSQLTLEKMRINEQLGQIRQAFNERMLSLEKSINDRFDKAEQSRNDRLDQIDGKVKECTETVKKQNGRIGRLENWRAFLLGVGSVLVLLIIPIFLQMITKLIGGS